MVPAMSSSTAIVLLAALCVLTSSAATLEEICRIRCLKGRGGGNLCRCNVAPFQGKRADPLAAVDDDAWNVEDRDPPLAPAYPPAPLDQREGMYRNSEDEGLTQDRRRFLGKIFRSMFE